MLQEVYPAIFRLRHLKKGISSIRRLHLLFFHEHRKDCPKDRSSGTVSISQICCAIGPVSNRRSLRNFIDSSLRTLCSRNLNVQAFEVQFLLFKIVQNTVSKNNVFDKWLQPQVHIVEVADINISTAGRELQWKR